MDSLKMQSPNLVDTNIEKIAALFPNCITEDRDENSTVRRVVDFDLLRQELSASLVEGPRERYTLNWPGKNEAILTANAPIAKTLRPCKEESIDFENTRNVFIEGDNLDSLKLLQETYLNKVKMIYIDPPYNTGNDFIYDDNFADDIESYKLRTNQVDEKGNRLIDEEKWKQNTASNGRYHSDWLSMMYSRLKLAMNLLTDDGVIFISIDENEIVNLQKICQEIFGESNVLGNFPVVMNLKGNQDAFGFAETHEYIIVCAKSKDHCKLNSFNVDEEALFKEWIEDEYGLYKEADNLRATGVNAPREKRPNLWYPIFLNETSHEFYITFDDKPLSVSDTTILPINPEGIELSWYWGKSNFNENKHNLILKKTTNGWQFYKKQRPQLGDIPTKKPKSFFYKPDYSTSTATTKLKELFGKKIFDGPKPVPFIKDLVLIGSSNDSFVLDFFSGSATAAHAVMQLNAEDKGNRKFIMVQLPEPCDEKSEAFKAGYKTIAEIGKERIRRAGKKIKKETHAAQNLDIGFRVFKVDTSNMKDVYYTPDELKQDNLELFKDHIKPDRSPEDLLFQVFIDWGLDLTLPITKETIDGKTVFLVDTNALIACFDPGINEELVKNLAAHKPLRVVFRDDAFGSDSVKINVEQIFKSLSPVTEVKSI